MPDYISSLGNLLGTYMDRAALEMEHQKFRRDVTQGPLPEDAIPLTQSILPPPWAITRYAKPVSGNMLEPALKYLTDTAKAGVIGKGVQFVRKGYQQLSGKETGTLQDLFNGIANSR